MKVAGAATTHQQTEPAITSPARLQAGEETCEEARSKLRH